MDDTFNERIDALAENLRAAGFTDDVTQVLMVAEEAGEFVGAFRRFTGRARRSGTFEEMAAELADVVIGAACCARFVGVDLDAEIARKLDKVFSRGWREPRSVAGE